MKGRMRIIAAGLVLILLAGLLAGCGYTPAPVDGAEHPLQNPAETDYAIIEVVEITNEASHRNDRLARCIFHYCSGDFGREGSVRRIYLPEEMAASAEPGRMYLVELDTFQDIIVRSSYGDDPMPIAFPFADGKLVYENGPEYSFRNGNIERFNSYLKNTDREKNKLAHLLPAAPIGTGSTVEEVKAFFEDFLTYYATMRGWAEEK